MKIIAWNVNGLRSIDRKFILDKYLTQHKPDIFCMGETKLSLPDTTIQESMNKIKSYQYRYYATSKDKKGYSGTAIWSKHKPESIYYGISNIGIDSFGRKLTQEQQLIVTNNEGRIITLEFKTFYLVHCYVPNAGVTCKTTSLPERLQYRVRQWDPLFQHYIDELQKLKPIILCGDLNCAHTENDIHNPKQNLYSAGFTIQERNSFTKYMKQLQLVDTFRLLHPNKIKYTYWSYRGGARKNNKGWRIDYFLASKVLAKKIKTATIHEDQMGSDHAPIELQITI